MADYYFNPITGNDTTGNGSSGNPYKTVYKIGLVATGSGNVAILKSGQHTLVADVDDYIDTTKISEVRSEDNDAFNTYFDGATHTYRFCFNIQTSDRVDIKNIGWIDGKGYPKVYTTPTTAEVHLDGILLKNNKDIGSGWGHIYKANYTAGAVIFNIKNCIVWDFNDSAYSSFLFILGGSGSTVDIYNNTFYFENGVPNLGIVSEYSITTTDHNWTITNNIIENRKNGVTLYLAYLQTSTKVNLDINHNDKYAHSGGVITDYAGTPSSYSSTDNITSDPKFVDSSNGDFTPQYGSPVENAGVII